MGFGFFQEEGAGAGAGISSSIFIIFIFTWGGGGVGVGPGIPADLGAKHIQLHENRVVNQDDELYAAQQCSRQLS